MPAAAIGAVPGTVTCVSLAAATGMGALTHAVEAFLGGWSPASSDRSTKAR